MDGAEPVGGGYRTGPDPKIVAGDAALEIAVIDEMPMRRLCRAARNCRRDIRVASKIPLGVDSYERQQLPLRLATGASVTEAETPPYEAKIRFPLIDRIEILATR